MAAWAMKEASPSISCTPPALDVRVQGSARRPRAQDKEASQWPAMMLISVLAVQQATFSISCAAMWPRPHTHHCSVRAKVQLCTA